MLLADAAQHEAEGDGLRAVFLVDDLRVTEVRLPVVHKLGVHHFVSGLLISGKADSCRGVAGVEMFHLADQRDRGIDRTACRREGLHRGRDWQGAEPAGDSAAPPRGGDQIMRQVDDGAGLVCEEDGRVVPHCDKLAVVGDELHGVEEGGSVVHLRGMPFHPLGDDTGLLHFARCAEFLPERAEGDFEKWILRRADRVEFQPAPIALQAFGVARSEVLRSHPRQEIQHTVTEGTGPSLWWNWSS